MRAHAGVHTLVRKHLRMHVLVCTCAFVDDIVIVDVVSTGVGARMLVRNTRARPCVFVVCIVSSGVGGGTCTNGRDRAHVSAHMCARKRLSMHARLCIHRRHR